MTYDDSINTLNKHQNKLGLYHTDFSVWLSTAIEHVQTIFSILSPQYSSITSLKNEFDIEKITDKSQGLINKYQYKANQLFENFIEQLLDRKKQAIRDEEYQAARAKEIQITYQLKYNELLPLYRSTKGENEQLKVELKILSDKLAPKKIYFGSENGIYKIKHDLFWTVLVILLGSFFTFGYYVGTTKYDKEKIILDESNKQLVSDTTSLRSQFREVIGERDSLLIKSKKDDSTINFSKRISP